MPVFFVITIYQDEAAEEAIFKQKVDFAGKVSVYKNVLLNTLRTAPFVEKRPRENLGFSFIWLTGEEWEYAGDYLVRENFEGCTLVFADVGLMSKGLDYFGTIARGLLLQDGIPVLSPDKRDIKEIISAKPAYFGFSLDLKEIFRRLFQRKNKGKR